MERGTSMHGGRGIDRSLLGIGLALVAGAFLIAWLALPSGAIAKKHQKGKGLALKFKGSTQSDQALLSSGNVSVVVNSSKKRKLVLAVRGFGGGPTLTDPLGVKAKAGKKKSVSLPLSSTGREVLQGCGANSLLLTAKTKGRSRSTGRTEEEKEGQEPDGSGHAHPVSPPVRRALARGSVRDHRQPRHQLPVPVPERSLHGRPTRAPTPGCDSTSATRPLRPTRTGCTSTRRAINTSDGFSPGAPIVTRVPGLDTPGLREDGRGSRSPTWTRPSTPNQPIVLIDAATGQRQLIWAELDSNATSPGEHRPADPGPAATCSTGTATSSRCAT